jgi:octaprenyl-diphosphate synthase
MSATIPSSQNEYGQRNFAALLELLQPGMRALDAELRQQVAHFEPEVRDLAAYCLESTGKRLRPLLVFLSGWNGSSDINSLLVRAAAVVEMTHLATLVHDDIMDQAMLRRGRTTVSAKDGPALAVLLGDALFAQSVWLSTQFPDTEVCRSVALATRRVCSGEIVQTLGAGGASPSRERYSRIIDLKTAELFHVSCRLGARLGGGVPEWAEAAGRFGRRLGIAYQIYDDMTDFLGTDTGAGKTLGTDWASGKLTLPVLCLLEASAPVEADGLLELMRRGDPKLAGEISGKMAKAGVFAKVAGEARAEIAAARAELAPWTEVPATVLLSTLASYLEEQIDRLVATS